MIKAMPDRRRPMEALARAVELREAGTWHQAHEIVQGDESELGAWLHGIVHTLEGHLDNALYWYRKGGRAFPGRGAVPAEVVARRRAGRGGDRTPTARQQDGVG